MPTKIDWASVREFCWKWKWQIAVAVLGFIVLCCIFGCGPEKRATVADNGSTSATMDMSLQSNETALKRADAALAKATAANDSIRKTTQLIAAESTGKSHTALWGHTNTIENASMTIGSSLEDIHANQVLLALKSKEVKRKEADLAARENRLAEIEAESLEKLLGMLRLSVLLGGLLVIGGGLLAWLVDKKWGIVVACAGAALGGLSLVVLLKYKEFAEIGFWIILACVAVAIVAGIITILKGRTDEVRVTLVGSLLNRMFENPQLVTEMKVFNRNATGPDPEYDLFVDAQQAYAKSLKKVN